MFYHSQPRENECDASAGFTQIIIIKKKRHKHQNAPLTVWILTGWNECQNYVPVTRKGNQQKISLKSLGQHPWEIVSESTIKTS